MNNNIVSGMFIPPIKEEPRVCNEKPFFLNTNGDIAFRNDDFVVREVIRGSHKDLADEINILNYAFKLGYETVYPKSFSDL